MDSNFFPTLVGVTGAAIILAVFILNQFNKIDRDSIVYDLLNLIGSIFLISYALLLSSLPFLILNAVWAGVSLRDVIKYIRKRYRFTL